MGRKAFLILISALLFSPAWASNALDGMIMKVKVTPDDSARESGERSFKDRLVFQNGKMTAEECVRHGFSPSDYETTSASGGISFSTTQKSDKEGTDVWGGNLVGRKVEGTLMWRKQDGRTFTYTFKGNRKD